MRIVAGGLFLLLMLAGCRPTEHHMVISSVDSEELLSIGKTSGQGPVRELRIRVEGELEGAAQLVLIEDGVPRHLETLSGPVNLAWRGDWKSDRARLHYIPGLVTGGRLEIFFRFEE